MVVFFTTPDGRAYAVESSQQFSAADIERLQWLFSGAMPLPAGKGLTGKYVGPRKEMITPWSTNAVEITQNMGVHGISRIEQFVPECMAAVFDPMLHTRYSDPSSEVFHLDIAPAPQEFITDISEYNAREGLALSEQEEDYLRKLSARLGRPLTDSEVFGFSQVNSEHCRHKIFNGTFIVDGAAKPSTLFQLIKRTSKVNSKGLVSAYKDNVAFVKGPKTFQFAPMRGDEPSFFSERAIDTVVSLKAETHNFPTTVEPFNGAATGSGGEIRDRLGGGRASLPLAGTAVYMTSYPRIADNMRPCEKAVEERKWLYQTPADILIKASNGASDFGNKFGQPLICGSLLTFEHAEDERIYGYDKVIMLAGGVGFANARHAIKGEPEAGQTVMLAGGDNYRIGMGGGAVSSVETGQYANAIELNAVQRANPEMQKRVSNVVRALAEMEENPCVSIHDHGAGGHLNALSELVEATGGKIDMKELPVGDTTLSAKEIIGNESQERMGLVMHSKDVERVRKIAEREQAPFYVVGETTDDARFVFEQEDGCRPIDLAMADMFGNSPKTVMTDSKTERTFMPVEYSTSPADVEGYIRDMLGLEAVGCKDWLTNKVDRSVTGRIARQQCQGELQLPLSDCGVATLDYHGKAGIATSIGHAPQAALIDPAKGSVLSIAEALTNISGALLKQGLKSVSLSANWMWPCKNTGQDAALYEAVKACSDFACALGINIPTGKDSLSMTQKYGDKKVMAPGTVIISAAGEVRNVRRVASPVAQLKKSSLIYIDMSRDEMRLGGSAFAQSLNRIGDAAPTVTDPAYFARVFNAIQKLLERNLILAQHDVSAGGLATALLEMTFANTKGGLDISLDSFGETDIVKILFAENPAIVIQVADSKMTLAKDVLDTAQADYKIIGKAEISSKGEDRKLNLSKGSFRLSLPIEEMRRQWFRPSFILDMDQTAQKCAEARFMNLGKQPVRFRFPADFKGSLESMGLSEYRPEKSGVRAAIIREKGVNGDREMAYSLYLAGFDVKDVAMTDITSGRETLEDVNMIVFCGGFSNSDVLGSAKGWAGQFLFNEKAKRALDNFYARHDTLSLGICNGCQLMIELGLITPELEKKPRMLHNDSGKFESTFLSLDIPVNNSVMLGSLAGSRLGIWVAHGEGKFQLPGSLKDYNIAAKYSYASYPGNPNGSRASVAAITSRDGRHLAMMPHLERAIFPWQCGFYPSTRLKDDATPWLTAFVNARRWIEANISVR